MHKILLQTLCIMCNTRYTKSGSIAVQYNPCALSLKTAEIFCILHALYQAVHHSWASLILKVTFVKR